MDAQDDTIRVKICGVTQPGDALIAARAGANAVGMVFAASKRQIDTNRAAEIVAVLPPFVTPVGLFVDTPADTIRAVADQLGLGMVQLHGCETLDDVAALAPLRVLKAYGIADAASVDTVRQLAHADRPGNLAAVLLDTAGGGGQGRAFDWSLVAGLSAELAAASLPIMLAGGLNPDNVADAVLQVRPWAVDVSSGVESAPGIKDPAAVARFIIAARRALDGPADCR